MIRIWRVTVLVLVVLAVAGTTRVRRQGNTIQFGEPQRCSTPRNEIGKCVGIRSCPELLEILRTRRNEPGVSDYLRASVCGYDSLDPRVCCPVRSRFQSEGGNQVTSRPPTGFEQSSRPPTGFGQSSRTPVGFEPSSRPPTGFEQSSRTPVGFEQSSRPPSIFSSSPPSTDTTEVTGNNRSSRLPVPPQCGFSNVTFQRVVNGEPAKLGAWPWIVALGYKPTRNSRTNSSPDFKCGGTLITERHVITAGHCVHEQPGLYMARLGDLDLVSNSEGANPIDIPISSKKIHERYSSTQYTSDIAILTLQRRVQFTTAIHPICLLTKQELRSRNYVSTRPFIAGWGTTSFRGPTSSILQQVQLSVVDTATCKRAFQTFHNTVIDDRVVCATDLSSKSDACQGDSGGPLMLTADGERDPYTFYLLGVISYGFKCAEPGFPGVYTRVSSFMDWIEKNTK